MNGWVAGWVAGWGNQWMTDGRLGRTHPGPTQCILPFHVPLWFSRQIMAPGRSLLSLWPAAGSTAWPPEPLSRCCPITARLSVPRELVLPGAPPHLPSIRPHMCSLLDASPIVTSVTPRTVCPSVPPAPRALPLPQACLCALSGRARLQRRRCLAALALAPPDVCGACGLCGRPLQEMFKNYSCVGVKT